MLARQGTSPCLWTDTSGFKYCAVVMETHQRIIEILKAAFAMYFLPHNVTEFEERAEGANHVGGYMSFNCWDIDLQLLDIKSLKTESDSPSLGLLSRRLSIVGTLGLQGIVEAPRMVQQLQFCVYRVSRIEHLI